MASSAQSILALDYGEKRIGYALANTVARLPSPAGTLEVSTSVWKDLTQLVAEQDIKAIVIGLPRGLDGQETAQTAAVRAFSSELATYTTIPRFFQDEALTSVQAEDELRAKGIGYNKGDVDALAATYILSDFLAAHPEV